MSSGIMEELGTVEEDSMNKHVLQLEVLMFSLVENSGLFSSKVGKKLVKFWVFMCLCVHGCAAYAAYP